MVSLDSMLEKKVEQRTLLLINWHRNTQLHQYVDWLRVVQGDVNNQLNEQKMIQHIATLDRFWQSLSFKINDEMARLLPLLNVEQREELFSSITDKNDEFREDDVDLDNDKRIVKYTKRMMDNYETWLGDLTETQIREIKIVAANIQSRAALQLKRRKQWQQSIQRILYTNNSSMKKTKSLGEYFSKYNLGKNVKMKNIEKTNRLLFARLTVKIAHSMTEEQKSHFISRTNDYIRMFNELADKR